MFYSVSLFSQAPLARGSRALLSVLFLMLLLLLAAHFLRYRFCLSLSKYGNNEKILEHTTVIIWQKQKHVYFLNFIVT